ncbi:MAG TPA: GNAT family N-acetyltransferase [Clostridia bacterium]|nr:GNAT family N-acetyltransferase [Clostridia bacterium]
MMKFHAEKNLGLCGLACVLCGSDDCPGCKARGCKEGGDCSVYQCVIGKGLDGCYQCGQFPCEEKMLKGIRNRAFNQYARQFGKKALLDRLQANCEDGIAYHQSDGSKGDYDLLSTEDEIMQLIQFGRNNPYVQCPTFETEHFIVRLIEEKDADDLLICYGDPEVRRILNTDNCPPVDYRSEMSLLIREWIGKWIGKDYAGGYFIRFSIIDKQTDRAVGTMEVYDGKYGRSDRTTGILRIDIAAIYEKDKYLTELFRAANDIFFDIFHAEKIVYQAFPELSERISALSKSGFRPAKIKGRKHYWVHEKG